MYEPRPRRPVVDTSDSNALSDPGENIDDISSEEGVLNRTGFKRAEMPVDAEGAHH